MTDLPRWAYIQKRTFTAWCNHHLRERVLGIKDLFTDFSDGVLLINLLELISESKEVAQKWNKQPKMRAQKLENCNQSLKFLKRRGIKLIGIGSEDIVDGHGKLILGLIWTLILRYHIQKGGSAVGKAELLEWVRKKIPECDVKDFTKSWQDGKAICHLSNALCEGCVGDLSEIDRSSDALANATRGENAAENEMDIPMILSPEDMVSDDCDELSTMTYISYFRDYDLDSENRQAKRKLADPRKSLVSLPETSAEQFIPVPIKIQARNAYSKNLEMGNHPFQVAVSSGGKPVEASLTDNNDGTFVAQFVPLDPGAHQIVVTLEDKPVSESPYHLNVAPSTVRAEGEGLATASALLPAHFSVILPERLHSDTDKLLHDLASSLSAPSDSSSIPVTLVASGRAPGTYDATYSAQQQGNHKLNLTLFGRPIAGAPYLVRVTPPPATVFGDSLSSDAGAEQFVPTVVTVSTPQLAQSGITLTASDLAATLKGPSGDVPIQVSAVDNGAFELRFTPLDASQHSLDVSLKEQTLSGSPFNISVKPSSITVSGPGVEAAELQVPTEFVIDAQGAISRGASINKDDLSLSVSQTAPSASVPFDVTDRLDGTFEVRYTASEPCPHTVTVDLKGRSVANSPYSVPVGSVVPIDASGEGLSRGEALIPSRFVLNAGKLADKGVLLSPDDFEVDVFDEDGNKIPAEIGPVEGENEFPVNYTPVKSGRHKVDVRRKGKPLNGCPFSVNVDPAQTFGANSTATGRGVGLDDSGAPPGEPIYIEEEAPFVVIARNKLGVPTGRGGALLEVSVTGPSLEQAQDPSSPHSPSTSSQDAGDGTYPCKYTPLQEGEHTVQISLEGEPISGSPFVVSVGRNPNAFNPSKSRAYGPGLEEGNTAEPSTFVVESVNGNGDRINTGGLERLAVQVAGPDGAPLDASLKDNGDGSYSAEYNPTEVGDHTVSIFLRPPEGTNLPPTHVASSPYKVTVQPGTDASQTVLSGPGVGLPDDNTPNEDRVLYDTLPTWFDIRAKDRRGKDIPTGGDPFEVFAINEDTGDELNVELHDNGDGSYRAKFAPVKAGRHKVGSRLRGKPVGGSPYSINVNAGATEDSFVEKFSFIIRTRTKDGQLKTVGGDKFVANVISPEGTEVEGVQVTDLDDGRHEVSYAVTTEGEYRVYAKINGRNIKGSPWKQLHYTE